VLARSVVGDLECAYDNYFAGSSVQSDEFESSNSNVPGANWGERSISPDEDDYAVGGCEATGAGASYWGLHVPMQTARFQGEDIFKRLSGWTDAQVPSRGALMATVRTYGAYPYTFFGETYCSIAFDGGPEVTPAASLAIAEQRFTEAISLAQASGNTDILSMAQVGLARTEMDLKNWDKAAQFASQVPVDYVKMADRGTENSRRWNKIDYFATILGAFVVSCYYRNAYTTNLPPDPCAGIPLLQDPRVLVRDTNHGAFNPFTDLWITTKYPAESSPIRLASYREAQLILAEAKAQQGDVVGALAILNARREEVGLADVTAGSQAEAVAAVVEERRRELSFEGGHRLNDLLRYHLPWKGANGSTQHFNPFSARPYGALTCWPLPTKERAGA